MLKNKIKSKGIGLKLKIIFNFILFLPLIIISIFFYLLIFQTNIPQEVYIGKIRNIYFDCLMYTETNVVYKAKPGECQLTNIEYSTKLTHDNNGYRNANTRDNSEIIVIGDSHAHGFGVNDSQTFSFILEKKYFHKTKNLGIGSYATKRELESLKEYTNNEKVVVIQYCDNDINENEKSLELPDDEFNKKVKEIWEGIIKIYLKNKIENKFILAINDATIRLTTPNYESKSKFYSTSDRDINNEAKVFSKIVSKYRAILENKQIIVFESAGWGKNHPNFKETFEKQLKEINPSLNFTILNSNKILSNDNYYFLDDHLNVSGHAKIAEVINSVIDKNSH